MCCGAICRRSRGSSPPVGKVTSACLWHACQAITVGILLIAIGIVMSILGKEGRYVCTVVDMQ